MRRTDRNRLLTPVCTGTHLGQSQWYSLITAFINVDDLTQPAPQYGDMTFTAANGSTLYGYFEGQNVPRADGGFDFWGRYWIYGGTDRFEGATGRGFYYGGGVGEVLLYFVGELVKP